MIFLKENTNFLNEDIDESEFIDYVYLCDSYTYKSEKHVIDTLEFITSPRVDINKSIDVFAPILHALVRESIQIKMISREDFYEVFEVTNKETNKIFLAKVFYVTLDYYSSDEQDKIFKSLNNILQVNHPSIIKSFNFSKYGFISDDRPTLLTEFTTNITLNDAISKRTLNSTKKLINIYGIASGMSYLHSKNILHYDLTPINIIEDSNLYPKIKDFGLNGIFKDIQSLLKIKKESKYLAPECYTDNIYTKESEVYSFGLIVYQIMTNKMLFADANITLHAKNIINEDYSFDKKIIPPKYQELIKNCILKNPAKRPTFENIVKELDKNREFITQDINEEEFEKYKQYNKTSKSNHETPQDNVIDSIGNNNNNNEGGSNDDNNNNDDDNDGGNDDDISRNSSEEEEEDKNDEYENEEEKDFRIEREEISFLKNDQIRNIKEYKKGKVIAQGSSCTVIESIVKKEKLKYAGKEFIIFSKDDLIKEKEEYIEKIKRNIIFEIKIQSIFLNPSIIKFSAFCPKSFDKTSPIMMLEFMENGSIEHVIKKINNDKQTIKEWNDTTKMINIYGIASAMKCLHSQEIIHRDLKPANVLLDNNFYPKLTDFGISINAKDQTQNNEVIGTLQYIAPEIWTNSEYSKSSDVYAFGILVYEIMTNTLVYRNKSEANVMYLVTIKKQSLPKADISKFYNKLINSCINENPKKRPTFDKIVEKLEKEFLNNSDLDKYKKYLAKNKDK